MILYELNSRHLGASYRCVEVSLGYLNQCLIHLLYLFYSIDSIYFKNWFLTTHRDKCNAMMMMKQAFRIFPRFDLASQLQKRSTLEIIFFERTHSAKQEWLRTEFLHLLSSLENSPPMEFLSRGKWLNCFEAKKAGQILAGAEAENQTKGKIRFPTWNEPAGAVDTV